MSGAAFRDGQRWHDQQRGDGEPGYRLTGPGVTGQVADALGGEVGGEDEERDADEAGAAGLAFLPFAA